jgi:NADPH:quinone reductase-like Zn-dependent oxidoreductase
MRVMAIEGFGGPDALRQMALPQPAPARGEIQIRTVSAGVNPVDCMIRAGQLKDQFPHEFPLVPGWDVAGVVESFGEGAGRFRKGDRVWACARKPEAHLGTYAEYVSVAEDSMALMPSGLLFEEAASVPLAALAAWQCLFAEPPVASGSTVLVHAAAGGTGHFAVQFARHHGARVVGTASAANHSFVLGLGAEACIDYSTEDFREGLRRLRFDTVDLAIDLVGGDTLARSYEVVRRGGRLVSLAEEPDAGAAKDLGITVHSQYVEPRGELLERIARLFDAGAIKTQVQKIYPLAKAAEAHRVLEQRHVRGKLVLNL